MRLAHAAASTLAAIVSGEFVWTVLVGGGAIIGRPFARERMSERWNVDGNSRF